MDNKSYGDILKKFIQGIRAEIKEGKFFRKDRLLIILLTGVLLLVIALPSSDHKESLGPGGDKKAGEEKGAVSGASDQSDGSSDTSGEDYAACMEERLSKALYQVEGVGRVKVMVTLQASAERVVEKDMEKDSETVSEEDGQGGVRSTKKSISGETTVFTEGGGEGTAASGAPYVTKELSPKVEGVMVVAEGGGRAEVVQSITEAVQALFDVDTHKIKVMKLK